MVAGAAVLLSGCAQPAADNSFTVRNIQSAPARGNGTVRIRLTTSGEMAEADGSEIVQFVKIVAVREATKRQRQIAESRARVASRKISPAQKSKPRKARYLAVETAKSAPRRGVASQTSVMIWDTQAEAIVGNNVYDVERAPAVGTVARFETYAAEYVGGGF